VRLEGLGKLKNINDHIGSRTRDLPACSIVPQQTALPRAQKCTLAKLNSVALVRERIKRQSELRLSTKLMPTFADRGFHVVSQTNPHGHILDFLDRSRYFFFQVAPQLYPRG
jgi:hypothetical protein